MFQWVGKALGGLLGFAAAGPMGSLLGVVLGHRFDQGVSGRLRRDARWASVPEEVARGFFQTTFELMGRIAKADGRVSEEEIRVARRIMHAMRLPPAQVGAAIGWFTAGKRQDYPLAERLEALARRLAGRASLARAFVEIQMQAAIGAGPVDAAKRRLLWRVASALGISRVELAQIEALVRVEQRRRGRDGHAAAPALDASYRVLGVAETASDAEVKRAYRRLMNQHHPDKLVARGLPESMVALALQKTHEIRAAYERIKTQRAFK